MLGFFAILKKFCVAIITTKFVLFVCNFRLLQQFFAFQNVRYKFTRIKKNILRSIHLQSLVWNLNGFFFSRMDMFYCNSEIPNVTFEGPSSLHEPTLCVSSDLVSTWILHHMKCTEKFSLLHELSCVISIEL